MEGGAVATLVDLSEDALCCILSFLRPADVRACSLVCKRLRDACRQDGKAWTAMCCRRWGSFTSPLLWGKGQVSFTLLYTTLSRWEHLIGFWRGVGNGFLALFEWGPDFIVGYKVLPAGLDTYAVRRIPFLWMTVSPNGEVACLLDPTFKKLGKSTLKSSLIPVDSCSNREYGCISSPSVAALPQISSLLSPNRIASVAALDVKALLKLGMLLVDVHFVGYQHLVIEGIIQKPDGVSNELAEAATLAAFGSSHNHFELSPLSGKSGSQSSVLSPLSSSSDTESCIGSPPGSFEHEMYQFIVNKVTRSRAERAARKQRRRDRERALISGRSLPDPEHFVKVVHSSPTRTRPLQGLWKGFFDTVGLDFVLISYDDEDGIICRKVQDLDGTARSGSVLWTSEPATKSFIPSCVAEEALYKSRIHTGPLWADEMPFDFCKVCGIFCTSSCDFQSLFPSDNREGRIWQYTNGTFGFGYCHSNVVTDFRALCAEGFLLDVVD